MVAPSYGLYWRFRKKTGSLDLYDYYLGGSSVVDVVEEGIKEIMNYEVQNAKFKVGDKAIYADEYIALIRNVRGEYNQNGAFNIIYLIEYEDEDGEVQEDDVYEHELKWRDKNGNSKRV